MGFSKALSNQWLGVDKGAASKPRVFGAADGMENKRPLQQSTCAYPAQGRHATPAELSRVGVHRDAHRQPPQVLLLELLVLCSSPSNTQYSTFFPRYPEEALPMDYVRKPSGLRPLTEPVGRYLSLFPEHSSMIKYGIKNTWELMGCKMMVCDSPLCRLNIEPGFRRMEVSKQSMSSSPVR
ncbi:hypothetical protein CB1_078589001 [Camelus ferus]|nr:hypothetical protein CB1_078589001 [Camelus ferus]